MQFTSGNIRAAWQGLKSMACINQYAEEAKQLVTINGINYADLPNTFNCFFSRFERSDFISEVHMLRDSLVPQRDLVISQDRVTALLKKTNIRKAAGLDAICGRTLKYCSDQLSEIFSSLFQLCADHCKLPSIWKTSTIIPILKSKNRES